MVVNGHASNFGSVEERFDLITRRLAPEDITGADQLKSLLGQGRKLHCLWVTSPTGKPHVGYFVPLLKFADFIRAGCEITVVLLDVYSYLDNVKYPMEQVLERMNYYKYTVMAALEAIGIPSSSVRFVQESSYQMSERWIRDQWRLMTLVPQQSVRDAWDRSYNPDILSPMLCPGLQTLAEEHLNVDFQFGGQDQKGIFAFAERFLPQMGYEKRPHLMNPMLPNLFGGKMSSSHPAHTKIMFLDDPETVRTKINQAYDYAETNGTVNGVLFALRDIIIPLNALHVKPGEPVFTVPLAPCGMEGSMKYTSFDAIEADVKAKALPVEPLKLAIADAFSNLLASVQKTYGTSKEWQQCERLGYPEDA